MPKSETTSSDADASAPSTLWTSIKRVIRTGFINFWRNGFVSLAAILIMAVTLGVIASVIFMGAVLNASLDELKDKVDVNVYFVTTASEPQIVAIKGALEHLAEVASVTYVSREQALADFQKRHENDQLTLQALDELGDNPLGATLNIKAQQTSQYESIAKFLESNDALGAGGKQIIDKVNYAQNKAAIDRLSRLIDSAETLGFVLTLVLIVISIIISFNTIRLAIYSGREEISVMRLVGASNMYIRGPFVIEGVMYGALAGIITLVLLYPITYWLAPYSEGFFGSINLFSYYLSNFGQMFLVIFGSGIALGALSSYLAVRRYLSV